MTIPEFMFLYHLVEINPKKSGCVATEYLGI